MKTNKAGLDLIKKWEGCELKAYKDSVGVWTIGWGHTTAAGPPAVGAGMTATHDQVNAWLVADLAKVEAQVSASLKVPVNENEFATLVSFTYNLGIGNLNQSTLLKRLNTGDHNVSNEFGKWINAGGKPLQGLINRRADEAKLWNTPVSATAPTPVIPAPVPQTVPESHPFLNFLYWLISRIFLGGK